MAFLLWNVFGFPLPSVLAFSDHERNNFLRLRYKHKLYVLYLHCQIFKHKFNWILFKLSAHRFILKIPQISTSIYNLNEKQTDFIVITIRMIYLVSRSKSIDWQRSGVVIIILSAYTQFTKSFYHIMVDF